MQKPASINETSTLSTTSIMTFGESYTKVIESQ